MAPRTGIYFSALLATLSCAWAVATTLCAKQPYKFVSLEGGGVKGICYGGSAAALEQAGLLNEVEGYSGSSAGSQAAALMAVGYTGKELTEELVSLDFAELLWASRGSAKNRFPNVLDDLMGLMDKFGWFTGEVLEDKIDEMMERKTGLKGTTFQQLRDWGGSRLRITATCVTTQRLMWLDADNTPNMSVAKAVRASSSIPIFFQPVEYEGLLLVDGGCIRNMPHDAFAGEEGSMLALSLRGEMEEMPEINSLLDFSGQLAETLFFGPDSANSLIPAEDDESVDLVGIDYGDVGMVEFGLSLSRKLWLVEQGFKAVAARVEVCGCGEVPKLPQWFEEMKNEAELKELEEKETDMEGLPEEVKEHVKNLQASLDGFAEEFDSCMNKEEDVAKCSFRAGRGAVEGGEVLGQIGVIFKIIAKDKRFWVGVGFFTIISVVVLVLAVVGWRAWRRGRHEMKGKVKKC